MEANAGEGFSGVLERKKMWGFGGFGGERKGFSWRKRGVEEERLMEAIDE